MLKAKRRQKTAARASKPAPTAPSLSFVVESIAWERIPGLKPRLRKAALAVAAHLPTRYKIPFTASLLLTTDARIKVLNHDFRGINKATNVLSFPQFEPHDLPKVGKDPTATELGDIALAYQTTAKEAKESNKLLLNHATHLVIHGLLHLFGYDHMMDEQAEKMEKLESKIMNSMGLPDPYLTPQPTGSANRNSPRRRK